MSSLKSVAVQSSVGGGGFERPSQWTFPRLRRLAGLYLYTDLSMENIIKVLRLREDGFNPGTNAVHETVYYMLGHDPRYLRPQSRVEMVERIRSLPAYPSLPRSKEDQSMSKHSLAMSEYPGQILGLPTIQDILEFEIEDTQVTWEQPSDVSVSMLGHIFDGDISNDYLRDVQKVLKHSTITISGSSDITGTPICSLAEPEPPLTPSQFHPNLDQPHPGLATAGDLMDPEAYKFTCLWGDLHDAKQCWCSITEQVSHELDAWSSSLWRRVPWDDLPLREGECYYNPRGWGAQDRFGNTPLHFVASLNGYRHRLLKMIQMLRPDSPETWKMEVLGARNTANETFLHVLAATWFGNISSPEHPLKHLMALVQECYPGLIYAKDHYGRTFVHRLYKIIDNYDLSTSFISDYPCFDPARLSRDVFGFNPVERPGTIAQLFSPPLRGGNSISPLTALADARHNHAYLIQVRQMAYENIHEAHENPQREDAEGRNGLHCLAEAIINEAMLEQQRTIISTSRLLKHKYNKKDEPEDTKSPLARRLEILQDMLAWWVDVNHYDRHGNTVLAAFITHIPDEQEDKAKSLLGTLKALIAHGAEVEARNRCGETALLVAARLGHRIALAVLLEHGANVHARDITGRGVFEIIEERLRDCAVKKDIRLYARLEACRALLAHSKKRSWGVVHRPTVLQEWTAKRLLRSYPDSSRPGDEDEKGYLSVRHETTVMRASSSGGNGARDVSYGNARGNTTGSINNDPSRGAPVLATDAKIIQAGTSAWRHNTVLESVDAPPSRPSDHEPAHNVESSDDSSRHTGICSDDSQDYDKNRPGSDHDCEESEDLETSWSGDESVSSDAAPDSLIFPILDSSRRQVVESLMVEFKLILNQAFGIRSHQTSTETSDGSTSAKQQSSSRESDSSNKGKGEHNRSFGNDGEGNRDSFPADIPDLATPPSLTLDRKLACPYFRRDPLRHKKHRSCAGPGWKTVHRVKEHVFRQHALPVYCARCRTVFGCEAELLAHQMLPERCEVRIVELPEGYSHEQERKLRKKRKLASPEEEKWKEMYQILFPDDDDPDIPTPYYENSENLKWEGRRDQEFNQYERYMRRELPRVVRPRLEQAVSAFSEPLKSQLRDQLMKIFEDARSELSQLYRQRDSSQSVNHTTLSEQAAMSLGLNHLNEPAENQDPMQFVDFDFLAFETQPPVGDVYTNVEEIDMEGIDLPRLTTPDLIGNQLDLSESGCGWSNIGPSDATMGAEAGSASDGLIPDPDRQDSSSMSWDIDMKEPPDLGF